MKRMILRNSTTSILRTPFKTALFVLLMTAVTAFLYLGINTWASSNRMLRECDETFTTIAVIEYIGTSYPDESVHDEAMLRDVDAIDYEAIAANENVLLWDPANCSIGVIEGFTAHSTLVPYSAYCVLTVKDVRKLQDDDIYYGTVVEGLYCYRPQMEKRHVYLYPDGTDFVPDKDAYYVVHGWIDDLNVAISSVHLTGFYSRAAALAGVDCDAIKPWRRIEAPEQAHTVDDGVYASMADFYAVMNNRVYVNRTASLQDREEFHQGWVSVLDGRMFTEQEQKTGANVCVITETIANSCKLSVGDRITIRSTGEGGQPAADCYWGADSMTESGQYEIVGVVNYYDNYQYNVYIPVVEAETVPQRYVYILGQATLKNGTAAAFEAAVRPMLPARATLSVHDQGYQATADSLRVIQTASVSLTAAAAAAALLILVCFAHLFVEKQRATVETMRCFGMRKLDVGLYLLFGAALIAVIACALGVLIGARYAGTLITRAYGFVSELQAVDLRYSDGYSGLLKEYRPLPEASTLLAALVAAGVFLLALGFCLYAARRTIEGRVMKKRSRTLNVRPPKRSSAIGGGPIRYSLLSIRRGGMRTLVVPAVAAAMLLFVLTLLATDASYRQASEKLCDNTVIGGSFVTLRGKYSGNLVVGKGYAQELIDAGYIKDVAVTFRKNYGYLGIVSHADGTPGDAEETPWPTNGFVLQRTLDRLVASPPIVATNDVAKAPEFYFSSLQATYAEGHGPEDFARTDWVELPCLLSTRFMEENGVAFGDVIRVFVRNGLSYSAENVPFRPGGESVPPFAGLTMRVIGSFYPQSGDDFIYCPLPEGQIDLDGLAPGEEPEPYRYHSFGGSEILLPESSPADMQYALSSLLFGCDVSSMSFSLSDARKLSAFKDWLEERGFSGPNQQRYLRVAVQLNDSDFMNAMSDVAQRSRYMEILYPVLLALCCAVGLITACLMQNARREEVAAMRGMGARRSRIFITFFFEQAALLALGSALGAGAWLLLGDGTLLNNIAPYLYAISYATGCALTVIAQCSRKALAVLSEKE